MESSTPWIADLVRTLGDQLHLSAQYVPVLFGALLVLLVGWVLARIVRSATKSLSSAINRLLSRVFPSGFFSEVRVSPRMSSVVGELLFWSILLISITVAARIAGLVAVTHWLDRITAHVPSLFASFAIVIIGYVLGLLVREQFDVHAQGGAKIRENSPLGKVAQGSTISIALILALDQLGIDVTLLVGLAIVLAAAVTIAFGVSVALGVRVYMTNVIGIKTARSHLHPGQRIRIDAVEGRILEITASQLALEVDEGKILVPGRFVDEQVTLIITPDHEGGRDDD